MLALLCGTAMVGLLSEPRMVLRPDNPRRADFGTLWRSVSEGMHLSEVTALMGPPDDEQAEVKQVHGCPDPCAAPCTTYHTCVRKFEWVSPLDATTSDVYIACADERGTVRETSTGMSFQLGWSIGDRAVFRTFASGLAAALLAVPVAGLLVLMRRIRPSRPTGIR